MDRINTTELKLLSKAFRDYNAQNKTLKDFEEDYDCTINYNDSGYILSISYNNDSTETMMKLKYE